MSHIFFAEKRIKMKLIQKVFMKFYIIGMVSRHYIFINKVPLNLKKIIWISEKLSHLNLFKSFINILSSPKLPLKMN